MAELELTRSPDDRRPFELDGVGALRVGGSSPAVRPPRRAARSWSFEGRGFWQRTIEASDATGTVVGSFDPRAIRRGGIVRWGDRELELRPASAWKERYALVDGDHELALLDGKGWGKRPVTISIDDPGTLEPGLLLFAVYLVRRIAEDAASTASAGGSGAATG